MPNPTGINQYTKGRLASVQIPTQRSVSKTSVAQLMRLPEGHSIKMGSSTARMHKGFLLTRQHDRYSPDIVYTSRTQVVKPKGLMAGLKRLLGR